MAELPTRGGGQRVRGLVRALAQGTRGPDVVARRYAHREAAMSTAPQSGKPLSGIRPPLQWLAGYQARWLRFDLLAGITLAAYAVPVSMAYATLAGLPPHHGIYCYLLGGLFYAAFGTSRQLAI